MSNILSTINEAYVQFGDKIVDLESEITAFAIMDNNVIMVLDCPEEPLPGQPYFKNVLAFSLDGEELWNCEGSCSNPIIGVVSIKKGKLRVVQWNGMHCFIDIASGSIKEDRIYER